VAASPLLAQLMAALRCLPGVGPKSAQRMALHLLERDRDGATRLVEALRVALDRIGHCRLCRDLSETEICALCVPTRAVTVRCCV
jgi:recombination protein RecR